jgi:hypothetical protein
MFSLDAGSLAIDLGPWVRAIELDMLDGSAIRDRDPSLAPFLEPLQDLVLNLHVPGVVVFARLQDSTGGRYRIAATLHLDPVEEQLPRAPTKASAQKGVGLANRTMTV